MNKTALKNFATWSRRKLIEQVQTKALLYGIDEKNGLYIEEQFGQLLINGQTYPLSMKPAFTALQKQLEQKGYKLLLEEAAYTWFNRIIAIRYMEVQDYLPEKVNVLSSSVGRVDPDILFEYDTMDLPIKREEVRELINAGNTEAAFRILFVAQCNALNRILPFMFEPIQDYTELLLPDFLLDAESVIKILVHNEELTESFAEIEVIGWLYQYYIAEEKDRVFAQKLKYKKEEIPFATQLFTPKWIVQYMVQNSLGRYWTEAHREDEDLIDNWEYFIKHKEEDFHHKIAPYVNKELKVEDIKLLDPAMGSGHILVYAFEVFHEIYEKCGYPEREIPRLILENNLYGIDIDDRAYQLAAFAVVMKAAQYSRRFLRSVEREGIQLNLASIQETNHISDDVIAYIARQEVGGQYNQVKAFFNQYHNAKTYGSLINITEREIAFIQERFDYITNNPVKDLFYVEQHEVAKKVIPALIHQTKIMRNEYDVVAMNPPYMGAGSMSKELGDFLKKKFPDSKADLFAAFMEIEHYLKKKGFYAAINQHSWMYLSSFDKLRNKLITSKFIDSMLHLGPRAFEDIGGEIVQSTSFIIRNYVVVNLQGVYLRLVDEKHASRKKSKFREIMCNRFDKQLYLVNQREFLSIPGYPISYRASAQVKKLFRENPKIGELANPRQGLATGNNEYFIRDWTEVEFHKIGFQYKALGDARQSSFKWFPINKGGGNKKWYGYNESILAFDQQNYDLLSKSGNKLPSRQYYFKKGITWSKISSSFFAVRYSEEGYIFTDAGMKIFTDDENISYLCALLNSKIVPNLLSNLSETMNYEKGNIERIPLILNIDNETKSKIRELVEQNIQIAKMDWDSFENSWDFVKHPFLKQSSKVLENAFEEWAKFTDEQFMLLKANEEELNRIFIEIYSLQNEMNAELDDKEVTVQLSNLARDVRSFLSYFVGCLVGRYAVNIEGLAYAGGKWNESKYSFYKPIDKAIIPLTEIPHYKGDIIEALCSFLATVLDSNTVEENLHFLAKGLTLKAGEDPKNRIRRYFVDEFFTDHYKLYNKRPIYWLVDSGNQKGLRALVYMHRYQRDTIATIRFEHLQENQAKYQQEIEDLENRLVNPNLSATDKKKLNAEKVLFEKKIDELREFDKRIAAIAAEEIEIDLDDGVKVNYEKFYRGGKGVLAKIK